MKEFEQLLSQYILESTKVKIDSSKELSNVIKIAQQSGKEIETDVNNRKVFKSEDNPDASQTDFDSRKVSDSKTKLNVSAETAMHKTALLNSGVKGKNGKLDFTRSDVKIKIGK
jgi:fructose-1,6-bisphosphatase